MRCVDMKHITDEDLVELEMYVELEGSEIGDTCRQLISLHDCSDYIGVDLLIELEREIAWNLENFRNNCEIVEEEVTNTTIYKSLEWNI